MKSLLEYSFKSVKNLTYENIKTQEEKDIYDKVVEKARDKIRKALRKHKTLLIIKTIYYFKNFGINYTITNILGNIYNKSIWRICLIHTLRSFIFSKTLYKRQLDIIRTYNIFMPTNKAEKEKRKIIKYTNEIQVDDISSYLKVYLAFRKYILPKRYL